MSEFQPEPLITLLTMEDVHKALSKSKDAPFGLRGLDRYKIKSRWLIELIDEIVSTGSYPYNATVKRLAESRLGFPPKRDSEHSNENDTLSLLIYNAQSYRRSDRLRTQGFEPFTEEVLERAFSLGRLLELESDVRQEVPPFKVRRIGGKLYAMRPKKRKYYLRPEGQPIRLIAETSAIVNLP
jgi:hypothetical protein